MEPAQHRERADAAAAARANCALLQCRGEALLQALMRPGMVEVRHVLAQHPPQVPLAQDQQVVKALAAHAPEEALAGRVLPGRAVGRAHLRDARGRRDLSEGP